MKTTTISPTISDTMLLGHATGLAEQTTGCTGAGSYLNFAEEHGFEYMEVVDWTSSAGDWIFIVSKNGFEWYLLYQTNNYPHPGFSHQIVENVSFPGSAEKALAHVYEHWEYA